jgi:hypothetical protein
MVFVTTFRRKKKGQKLRLVKFCHTFIFLT